MNFFVSDSQVVGNRIYINNSDVNHIKNVLRKKPGDVITIVASGIEYKAKIVYLSFDNIECEIVKQQEYVVDEPEITIFQGLAKADKIEYIIQKCTEIGVFEIVPTEMKRCVVKLDDKDKKIDRWRRIAEVASKQSLRNNILKIERVLKLDQVIEEFGDYDYVIVAYEKEEQSLKSVIKNIKDVHSKIAIVIGPEGGIDDEEFEKLVCAGAKSVSLGKRILRTETAPIVISSIIMYELCM